jgi:membrane protease YdiL (CAAX protease family)
MEKRTVVADLRNSNEAMYIMRRPPAPDSPDNLPPNSAGERLPDKLLGWPGTLTPTWVVACLSVCWIITFLFNYQELPYAELVNHALPLLWAAGMLWWSGASHELPIYFIGQWFPKRPELPAAALIVVVEIAAFYAFGWGQRGRIARPDIELLMLVPIAEEMLFRGLILTALISHAPGRPWQSVLVASLVFTSFHGIQNGWHLAWIMTAGILFGVGYVKTHSIPYCVFCHFLWNAMSCCSLMQHRT